MHEHDCPHCAAAHAALLDQIVEHKVEIEDLRDEVAELAMAVEELYEVIFGDEDEDEEDEDE